MNENKHNNGILQPYQDLTDFPAMHAMQVNNCGMRQNYPSHLALLRPDGRKDYGILYVERGWIEVSFDSDIVRLNAGKYILFMPGVKNVTYFSSEGNPIVYYVYFKGTGIEETMQLFQSETYVICPVENRAMLRVLFHQMVQLFRPLKVLYGRRPICQPGINGLLLQILDLLLKSKERKDQPERNAILPALDYMSEHFKEDINLEQCARMVNLSLGRFAHLFTQYTGISPYKFVISMRIDAAKDLLQNSSMSINDVAVQSGFKEPCYFSRIFRKHVGCTPKQFRVTTQGARE